MKSVLLFLLVVFHCSKVPWLECCLLHQAQIAIIYETVKQNKAIIYYNTPQLVYTLLQLATAMFITTWKSIDWFNYHAR